MAELSQTLNYHYVGLRRDVASGRMTELASMQHAIIQDYKEFGAVDKKKKGAVGRLALGVALVGLQGQMA